MPLPPIFITRRIPLEKLALARQFCQVDLWDAELPPSPEALLEHVRGVQGLLCLLTDRIDAAVMDAAGAQLRVISNCAVGFDNIDVAEATRRGIPVGNTPGVLTDTTADFAFALLMAAARRVVDGDKLTELRYRPWGETRYSLGSTATDRRYTGQTEENKGGLGLYFYNARFYDPLLGRFTSPDTIVPDPTDPAAYDRYAYTRNNPVRYVDPSGHGYNCPMVDGQFCNTPKPPPTSTQNTINQSSSIDYITKTVFIGARSGVPPWIPATPPIATDTTCFNCSVEPVLPTNALAGYGFFSAANDIGIILINGGAFQEDQIFFYLEYNEYINGNITVDSLIVTNTTGSSISVSSVAFSSSGGPLCENCIAPYVNSYYRVVPGASIHPAGGYYGLGTAPPNSTVYINLAPPGAGNRPSNLFYSYHSVSIYVQTVFTATGLPLLPITYTVK